MTFWLSFCDGTLPKGSQFLGVVIIDAQNSDHAVQKAWDLGINPGGEVMIVVIPTDIQFGSQHKNRLLTRQEAEAVRPELS